MVDDARRISEDARREIDAVERSAHLREMSKRAFGAQARLEVALAVMEHGGHVTNEYLRGMLGLSQSTVHGELADLEALGVVSRVPGTVGRTVYYRAKPHPFWEFCRRLADEAAR